MTKLKVSESIYNFNNIQYLKNSMQEIVTYTSSKGIIEELDGRLQFEIDCNDDFFEIVRTELADKIAEVIAINYKYVFFKSQIKIAGLTTEEKEIMFASLISADLETDKKYCYDRCKSLTNIAIDGLYNFYLSQLKKKWQEIVSYMPSCFINSQLKDFIVYLVENKKKKVYVDGQKVFDSHFRRLKRCDLLGGEKVKIIREVLLSNCGEIELSGSLPTEDEKYLKDYFGDKIIFSPNKFN